MIAFVVQVLSHESGAYDPDGVGGDVADGPGSYGPAQVGGFLAVPFFCDFCFYALVEGEKKGMENGNTNNIRSEAYG